mmetsp:Transcript_60878/g.137467  ORF Transcript_60878/g.137467 Transcript_60878/m.137467 type:complete len:102 (+) Transcript_60878:273-578(+)
MAPGSAKHSTRWIICALVTLANLGQVCSSLGVLVVGLLLIAVFQICLFISRCFWLALAFECAAYGSSRAWVYYARVPELVFSRWFSVSALAFFIDDARTSM